MVRRRATQAPQPPTTPRDTRQGRSGRMDLLTPGEQMSVPSERMTGTPLSRSTGSATSNTTGTHGSVGTTTPATGQPLTFTPNGTQSTIPIPWSQTPTPGQATQPATQESTVGPNKSQATDTGTLQSQKLTWTPALDKSALELYVQAVEDGKRSEGGFKPEVHRWVASELLAEFPGNAFTNKKVKSKLAQVSSCFYFIPL
ncbi:hypothetical protein H4Q26_006800 [Puccinia striiformis f. sp. tritici PST-130]|nr:hypothetical protein H4Q26_006800 [Puccinia striiformis f. sp. tritici PST-130]